MIGIESGWSGGQPPEALNHQTRTNEQHQRERDFAGHQRTLQTDSASAGRSPSVRFQPLADADARSPQSRQQSDADSGETGEGRRKAKSCQVHRNVIQRLGLNQVVLRNNTDDYGEARTRQYHPADASRSREQHTFHHQLQNQSRAASAQRRTNRNLALTSRAPFQQHARHIRAHDHEHEDHRAQEREDRCREEFHGSPDS